LHLCKTRWSRMAVDKEALYPEAQPAE
jgi:hypothetical protein